MTRSSPSMAMRWPSGDSELARLIRGNDWAATALGSVENWPHSLRTSVDIVVQSPVPMVLLWGADGTS